MPDSRRLQSLPDELKAMPFIVCEFRQRDAAGQKFEKIPTKLLDDGKRVICSRADADAHLSFDAAVEAIEAAGAGYGLMLYLPEDGDIFALDFDDCVSRSGKVFAEIRELMNLAGSYAERSPSGRGVRIFGTGWSSWSECRSAGQTKNGLKVERLGPGHSPTITGDRLNDLPVGDLGLVMEVLVAGPLKVAPKRQRKELQGDDVEFDGQLIITSLGLLKPERSHNYNDWLKVGSALSVLGDEQADTFVEFSRQAAKSADPSISRKFDEQACRQKFESLLDSCSWGMTEAAGTMMAMAEQDRGLPHGSITAAVVQDLGRNRAGYKSRQCSVTFGGRGAAATDADEESEPVPIGDLPMPEPDPLGWQSYPVEALGDFLCRFSLDAAASIEIDPAVIAHCVLAACGHAIGCTRQVVASNTWRPYPILWMPLVANSGDRKSPAIELPTSPVKRMQSEAADRHAREKEDFAEALEQYEELRAAKKPLPPKPQKPEAPSRIWTADPTPEALAKLLAGNSRGIFVICDELATVVAGTDRYHKRGGAGEGLWLSGFDGRPHEVDRATSDGASIRRAAVWITGGIQPGKVRQHIDAGKQDSGYAARLLPLMPPPSGMPTGHAGDIDSRMLDGYSALLSRLYELTFASNGDAVHLQLGDEARQVFEEFRQEHARYFRGMRGAIRAAMSKLGETPLRLAVVLHEVDAATGGATWQAEPSRVINGDVMRRACTIARRYRHEQQRFYRLLEVDDASLAWLQGVELASAGIIDELRTAGDPLSREEVAERIADITSDGEIVMQALANLLHRGVIVQAGDRFAMPPPQHEATEESDGRVVADGNTGNRWNQGNRRFEHPHPEDGGAQDGNRGNRWNQGNRRFEHQHPEDDVPEGEAVEL